MKYIWKIDHVHSELRFEIDYLMISKISGYITSFEACFQTDEQGFKNMDQIRFSAETNALTTNSELRDQHLRSKEFFDVMQYGSITFSGTALHQGVAELPVNVLSMYRKDFKLAGNLTIKGITKPVMLDGFYGGSATDMEGRKKAGFMVKTKINRNDFGLSVDPITEAGKLIIGKEITITGNCQFTLETK